jgi:hypothetical protein
LLCVENFRSTGSALKKKPPGGAWTVCKPQNIEAVRQSVGNSPHHSASKRAVALHISNRSVWRILHLDLHFDAYKLMVVQDLNECDWVKHKTFAENVLKFWQMTWLPSWVMKRTSTYPATLTNKTFSIGQTQFHGSFTSVLFTVNVWLSGAVWGQAWVW